MTFELYYWETTFFDGIGRTIQTQLIPNPSNLTIDYTVAGITQEPEPVIPQPDTPYLSGDININMDPVLSWDSIPEAISYKLVRESYHPDVSNTEILTTDIEVTDPLSLPVFPVGGVNNDIHYYVKSINAYGIKSDASNVVTFSPSLAGVGLKNPDEAALSEINTTIYPNPFNPTTNIQFSLASDSDVTIQVYNLLGQNVATLANSRYSSGIHAVIFDATNLSSGLYFVNISSTSGRNEFSNSIHQISLVK